MKNKTWLIIAIAIVVLVIIVMISRQPGEPTPVPDTTTTTEEVIMEDVLPVGGDVITPGGEVLDGDVIIE